MTEVDEVLKFDPGPNFKRPSQDDIVNEVLKFDPMRPKEEATPPPVGGTFQPKPSPFPGGTGPISTITGKPETRFVSGEEPGAEFVPMMKAGFVDDPYIKAKIFSEARGVPISRYRVNSKGNIEFKDNKGSWQREVSELPIHQVKQILANIIAHPSTTLGTMGAIMGGAGGAIIGAMGGETLRKGIAAGVYGEKQTAFGNLVDVGMEGLFALGGELAGKIFTGGINKFLTRKIKPLQLAGQEVREQLLSPQDHAKALWIQRLADQHNITLAPHQLYDKEGMMNVWKYLRKHPVTSDAVRTFEDNLAKQSDEAINGFIKEMGGFKKTPYTLGTRTQEVAEEIISEAIEKRSLAASPIYKEAFEKAPPVDIEPVIGFIDDKLEVAKGNIRTHLLKTKKILQEPDLPKKLMEPWDMTKEELIANPPKGYAYKSGRGYAAQRGDKVTNISDSFFELGVAEKKALINHEVGHDLVRNFNKNYKDVFDPLKKGMGKDAYGQNREMYENPFGFRENPEEIIADTYTSLFEKNPYEAGGKFDNLRKRVAKIAIREGKPVPPEVLAEYPELAKETLLPGTGTGKFDTSLEGLHSAKISIDDEIAKAEKARTGNVAFNYREIKKMLLDQMDKASPEYAQARKTFASKSEPVNRLKESVIGELSQLKTDKTVSGVAAKLLYIKDMPDEILLKEAKAVIFKKDPDLWNEIIGSYIRDVYQNLRIAEEGGKVLNVPGKMYKALYGNPKQRGILEAAMSSDQFKSFESLMQVFQRASIGVGKESMTAPFQAIGETMGVIPGSKIYRYAMFPKQAIVETAFKKWNDILVAGRQTELIKALASPDVIKKLEAIKPLKPGSKKFIEAFSVFTALIVDKVEIPEKQ